MTSLRNLSLLACLFLLCGCAKPQPAVKTEVVKVSAPVVYKLERPERPRLLPEDTLPEYVVKLTSYTEKLEVIIDEHNKKQGAGHVLP